MATDRDYVLGTHHEELARLGLQHRVWRPVVSDCWQRAGITAGKHVLDVGAGRATQLSILPKLLDQTAWSQRWNVRTILSERSNRRAALDRLRM